MIDLSPLRRVDSSEAASRVHALVAALHSGEGSGEGITPNGDLSSEPRLLADQTAAPAGLPAHDGDEERGGLALSKDCLLTRPIWDLPVLLLTFDCADRQTVKSAAKYLARELCFPRGDAAAATPTKAKRAATRRMRSYADD